MEISTMPASLKCIVEGRCGGENFICLDFVGDFILRRNYGFENEVSF